jgi:hypothetical protein
MTDFLLLEGKTLEIGYHFKGEISFKVQIKKLKTQNSYKSKPKVTIL